MFLTMKLYTYELFEIELLICIKMDLALNNIQKLICHKTQQTNIRVMEIPIVIDALATVPIGGIKNERKNPDHPDNSIVEISQNIQKCPEDLRRLAVIQTLVKDHQLTLSEQLTKK